MHRVVFTRLAGIDLLAETSDEFQDFQWRGHAPMKSNFPLRAKRESGKAVSCYGNKLTSAEFIPRVSANIKDSRNKFRAPFSPGKSS